MKFIHYLEKIINVSVYSMASMILFGSIFIIMLVWALKADKKMIEDLATSEAPAGPLTTFLFELEPLCELLRLGV